MSVSATVAAAADRLIAAYRGAFPAAVACFGDERSAMKLVFATMIRAADRWCRVSISDLERHQLTLLRVELGLDPPPATTDKPKNLRRRSVAA